MDKRTRRLVASGISEIAGNGTMWPHNLHICIAYVSHLGKDLSNVVDVNTNLWRMFMSVTLQAAFQFGNDYAENLHSNNQPKPTLKQLFNLTEKLIRDQKELLRYSLDLLAAAYLAKVKLAG